jgi:hypothetical protein
MDEDELAASRKFAMMWWGSGRAALCMRQDRGERNSGTSRPRTNMQGAFGIGRKGTVQ